MTVSILLVYLVLAATLGRAVLVGMHHGPALSACRGCGKPYERRALGEQICRCRD
jgi:hypothetical protein